MPPKSTCPSPSERKRAARSIQGREARIEALPGRRVELGVLHVEGADALAVEVDEAQVVEALQEEMRRVVVDGEPPVPPRRVEELLEGRAVEDVLARM